MSVAPCKKGPYDAAHKRARSSSDLKYQCLYITYIVSLCTRICVIDICLSVYAPGPVHSFPDCIVISAVAASRDALLLLPLSHNTVFLTVSTSHSAVVTGCLPSLHGQGPSPARRLPSFRQRRSTTPFGPHLRQHSSRQLVRRRHSPTAVVGPSATRFVAR